MPRFFRASNNLSHTTTARIVNFICVVVAPAGTLDARRGLTKLQVSGLRVAAIPVHVRLLYVSALVRPLSVNYLVVSTTIASGCHHPDQTCLLVAEASPALYLS